jgi:tol-pal system protein YbgF
MARPSPSWLAVAVICVGCAHTGAGKPNPAEALDPAVAAMRSDNAALRRKVATLEDRVVRLERAQLASYTAGGDAGAVPLDRDLPIVRLEPPSAPVERPVERMDEPPPAPKRARRGAVSKTLGMLPGSGGSADGYPEDEPSVAAPSESIANDDRKTDPGKSYRLVGNRLVELTKANAPKRPDRPARDSKGTAQLTEYEAAMALYKAGELAGAERAFELFARAHPKHDYADNALYWMGEAAYDQKEWDGALAAFTEVVERYGGGNKAPDALLKIGLCYGKLGDAANARDVLSELVAAYPDARASDIARVRLSDPES